MSCDIYLLDAVPVGGMLSRGKEESTYRTHTIIWDSEGAHSATPVTTIAVSMTSTQRPKGTQHQIELSGDAMALSAYQPEHGRDYITLTCGG